MDFVMSMATAAHRYGVPANRAEPLLEAISARLDVPGTFLVAPTSIQAAFARPTRTLPDSDPSQRDTHAQCGSAPTTHPFAGDSHDSRFARVDPGSEDLGKLAALDELATRVLEDGISAETGNTELQAILNTRAPSQPWLDLLAFAATSAIAARCFDGGSPEIFAAALGGIVLALLANWSQARPTTLPLLEGLTAFVIASLAVGVDVLTPISLRSDIVILASLIIMLPGLRLTTAVTEVATGHLASGVARLAATAVSFGALGFGVILARRVVDAIARLGDTPMPLPLTPPAGAPTNLLPEWTLWFACLCAPLGFARVLGTARRDVLATVCIAPLGFFGARLGGLALGADLGAFVGAFVVTASSNVAARLRHRPASVTLVPGILMLVPGALGFRSFEFWMARTDVVLGLEAAAQMATVAASLVAGMLVAGALVPARRVL